MADSTNSSTISPEIEVFRAFRFQRTQRNREGWLFLPEKPPMGLILPMSLIVLYAPEAKML
jgi:hypothetical protein